MDNTSAGSLEELIPLAYEELRRIARQRISQLRPDGTLAPTDLVHEVLLRLLQQCDGKSYNGTDHLIRVAALAMHNILVDAARRRASAKHGGNGKRVRLEDELPIAAPAEDMIGFYEACEVVKSHSQEHFDLILLRIYAGMSIEEIAAQRGQSTRTVERHWRFIRAILGEHMRPVNGAPTPSSKPKGMNDAQ